MQIILSLCFHLSAYFWIFDMHKVNVNKEVRAISSVCLYYCQAGVVWGCKMAFFFLPGAWIFLQKITCWQLKVTCRLIFAGHTLGESRINTWLSVSKLLLINARLTYKASNSPGGKKSAYNLSKEPKSTPVTTALNLLRAGLEQAQKRRSSLRVRILQRDEMSFNNWVSTHTQKQGLTWLL